MFTQYRGLYRRLCHFGCEPQCCSCSRNCVPRHVPPVHLQKLLMSAPRSDNGRLPQYTQERGTDAKRVECKNCVTTLRTFIQHAIQLNATVEAQRRIATLEVLGLNTRANPRLPKLHFEEKAVAFCLQELRGPQSYAAQQQPVHLQKASHKCFTVSNQTSVILGCLT